MKVIISFANYKVEADIYDTPTGRAIYEALPLKRNVNTWGDEIYFDISVQSELEEDAQAEVSVGELAYWPNMPAFCIFFGPTPVSTGGKPMAASAVNVFGCLTEVDRDRLRGIPEGENVLVDRVD
ncbi:MAG: hypothetical protein GY790_22680 [Bacteroidetes bacterium]|nr:hypothetical protein [Bacteroidota bacterium]